MSKQKETQLNYSRLANIKRYDHLHSVHQYRSPQENQYMISSLPVKTMQNDHMTKRMSEQQSVFSFSQKKSKRYPIFVKQEQYKLRQSLPSPKHKGQSYFIPKFDNLTIQTDRRSQSPSNKINLKKTFQYQLSGKPVHKSAILIKEKEEPLNNKPLENVMKHSYPYFKQANNSDVVYSQKKKNFSSFLEETQKEQKSKRIANPQTERKSKMIKSYQRKHQTIGVGKKYLPPWMQELSQRLHDSSIRNKKQSTNRTKRNQEMKREYFQQIIKDSHFASKILLPKQIQALFQQLKDTQPMGLWQSRVVDQWSLKLKKKKEYQKYQSIMLK